MSRIQLLHGITVYKAYLQQSVMMNCKHTKDVKENYGKRGRKQEAHEVPNKYRGPI